MFYSREANRRKHWYRLLTIGQKKLLFLFGSIVILAAAFLSVLVVYTWRAMQYDMALVTSGSGVSMLYDSQNKPVSSLAGNEGEYVPWEQYPRNLVNAFVAREDENFFEHGGVVYSAVLRSLLRNIVSMRYEQGASTITMQLTRNVFELHDKTLNRKLLEAILAQRIERHYDKKVILSQYLNRIYYGQNCYGIGEAARHYFGKAVSQLNLVECATLAGLVRAPSLCNPRRSMENAMGVKRETLARMLELEMITPEQCKEAVKAPIVLSGETEESAPGGSYATMWANRELETLRATLEEKGGGIAVVSNLNLNLQQYLEGAVEKALTSVEMPGRYPDAWLSLPGVDKETAEARKKAFTTARRPASFRVRGSGNDMEGLLQCCVLVVDARRNHKGNILAVVSGRSAHDGVDRWQMDLQPGRAAAPLLFCCACLPGGDSHHIVARSTEVTGDRLGYDVVRAFFDSLKLGIDLPSRENERNLYNGLYRLRRVELARLLFDVLNQGRGYRLGLIHTIWSRGQKPLYVYEPEKAPEYIRRESAVAVAGLPPFVCSEGSPVTLNETLPGKGGQWSVVFNDRGVAVFVWMGFDNPEIPAAAAPEMRRLLSGAALNLAREMHTRAREELKAAAKKEQK